MSKLGPSMTGRDFARFQVATQQHLSFSLTLACPLKCAHCMVQTVSPKQAGAVTLLESVARDFATQMPTLAALDIRRISFTGGEPLLARAQLAVLSGAAAAAGIDCTVVTACHWAKTGRAAARLVAAFPGLRRWHISTDLYHRDELDPVFVINAATAIRQAGAQAQVRMAVSSTPGAEEARLIRWLQARLPDGVPVIVQPVMPAGRAVKGGLTPDLAPDAGVPRTPCLTTGPLIRHDGWLLPCCSALAERSGISPFEAVDATVTGLAVAVRVWRGDPLLGLVRGLGLLIAQPTTRRESRSMITAR